MRLWPCLLAAAAATAAMWSTRLLASTLAFTTSHGASGGDAGKGGGVTLTSNGTSDNKGPSGSRYSSAISAARGGGIVREFSDCWRRC
jgi:hypothetical protein